MGEDSSSGQLLYMLGMLLAVFSKSMSTSVVVRGGQTVQMNCSFSVKETGFTSVTWLRQSNRSAPVSIITVFYSQHETSTPTYHNGFSSQRFTCTLANSICVLEIRNVSVSDSGLYYCGYQPGDTMIYCNATYLTITASVEKTDTAPTEKAKEEGWFCSGVCGTVVLVLGVLSAVLNLVLVLLILTKRRAGQNTESRGQPHSPPAQAQDSDSLNYAALSFSGKKKKRSNFNLQPDNPHVIYAATR
ncbi:uncharacterized protein LOC134059994 [Sardina pilchardus]|uniref:uncharacterized protein LOC134059994 n=1 Tax=Sardina pilchardus TaxID=27697 RepID=UPI002E14F03C